MNCQPPTKATVSRAPVDEPMMLGSMPNQGPICLMTPKLGSSSAWKSIAMAVVESSSGMKKTAERKVRLRCLPAAQTPSSSATGVWKAQLTVVSSRLSQAAWRKSGSLNSRVQLSVPTGVGEFSPSQWQKER